jgi:hypothetical protein
VTTFFGCIETQGRGALHFHVVLFGSVSPKLLEQATPFPEVCEVVSEVLDSMYSAELPKEYHLRDLVHKQKKKTERGRDLLKPKVYATMHQVPNPCASATNLPNGGTASNAWKKLHAYLPQTATGQAQMPGGIPCRNLQQDQAHPAADPRASCQRESQQRNTCTIRRTNSEATQSNRQGPPAGTHPGRSGVPRTRHSQRYPWRRSTYRL